MYRLAQEQHNYRDPGRRIEDEQLAAIRRLRQADTFDAPIMGLWIDGAAVRAGGQLRRARARMDRQCSPVAAAEGMAEEIGVALLLAKAGETFMLSDKAI
ncbi:hypothetical protein [Sphingomonas sp. BK069]|uniref:hypothetical protein n=1 Tax=Sphingomonas sp. BK069 TaxID=2586979 RepID=UPI0016209F4A|nr:hypothetical protein [Sphingomonas sp. BK069]MBB3349570.1 hypothetical protein [Sphingomonas sp. BK069]